jgi:hypothetical protein
MHSSRSIHGKSKLLTLVVLAKLAYDHGWKCCGSCYDFSQRRYPQWHSGLLRTQAFPRRHTCFYRTSFVAKTSCTPLTPATLLKQKANHPPPQTRTERTPRSPRNSTSYGRGSQLSDCSISHVNHLRPLSTTGRRSMSAEPNSTPALSSPCRHKQRNLTYRGMAGGFCRCTLSVRVVGNKFASHYIHWDGI